MRVNLYSGYSTLAVALSGDEPVIRYYPTDRNIQQLMQTLFSGMQLKYGKNYPLKQHEMENEVKIAYSVHDGDTPFTPQLEQAEAPDTHAIVLQPGSMENYFGLKGMGLFPIIESDIDLATAYERSDRILAFWVENEFNAYLDEEGEFNSGKNKDISEILHLKSVTPLDNHYLIAAREHTSAGLPMSVIDRETENLDVIPMPTNMVLDISMGYEVYSCDYVPLYEPEIEQKAQEYYQNGVPDAYKWLSSVQPLDFLSLWVLELGKTYTMRLYCPLGKGTSFGDELEFTVHHDDKYDSRYLISYSPTGEKIRLEDQAVPEWVHSYAAVVGEGADELRKKGCPQRDMLNLKQSLKR